MVANPVRSGQIEIKVTRALTLSVYNNNGVLVLQKSVTPGLQFLDMTGYAKGVYFVNGGALSERVIVK